MSEHADWLHRDLKRQEAQNDNQFEELCNKMRLSPVERQQYRDKVELDAMLGVEHIRELLAHLASDKPENQVYAISEITQIPLRDLMPIIHALLDRIEKLEEAVDELQTKKVVRDE